MMCLANIQSTLKDMKNKTVISSWKKLWPDVVPDHEGFTPDEVHRATVDKAVKLAQMLSNETFKDMTTEDVTSLIDCHSSETLTDEDLLEMTKSASEEEEEAADDDEGQHYGLSLNNIAHTLQQKAKDIDENMVRAIEFCNRIDGVMEPYKGIFAQMKKQRQQLPITMFLVCR